jgi:hypothetical protein
MESPPPLLRCGNSEFGLLGKNGVDDGLQVGNIGVKAGPMPESALMDVGAKFGN